MPSFAFSGMRVEKRPENLGGLSLTSVTRMSTVAVALSGAPP